MLTFRDRDRLRLRLRFRLSFRLRRRLRRRFRLRLRAAHVAHQILLRRQARATEAVVTAVPKDHQLGSAHAAKPTRSTRRLTGALVVVEHFHGAVQLDSALHQVACPR